MQATQELLEMATKIHIISIIFTILTALWIIFIFYRLKDYKELTKKYERYVLFYYFFVSTIFFTGLILLTILKFHFTLKVILMILAIFHLLITSIKLHRVFKNSRLKNIESQNAFVKQTKKKFILDIVVLLSIGAISYAIHI